MSTQPEDDLGDLKKPASHTHAALPAIEQHPKEKAAVYAGAVVVLNVGLMLIIKLYLY